MRDEWYGDKQDLVIWNVLLHWVLNFYPAEAIGELQSKC
jgi:hypothetical protein